MGKQTLESVTDEGMQQGWKVVGLRLIPWGFWSL